MPLIMVHTEQRSHRIHLEIIFRKIRHSEVTLNKNIPYAKDMQRPVYFIFYHQLRNIMQSLN